MFNWFRRNNKKNSISTHWGIEDIPGFEQVHNDDSIQYTNADGSKLIYLSILVTSGTDLLPVKLYNGEPTISEDANAWQFKGAKRSDYQILICVITVNNFDDIEWAKSFFESIKPNNSSN